ncbi:putative SWR1-complex protein 5/Craniofacial development protein [Dioscorea sansibarensis]
MAAFDGSSDAGINGGTPNQTIQDAQQHPNLKEEELEEHERKARVNAAWEKMNSGLPSKVSKPLLNKPCSTGNKATTKSIPNWMVSLGMAPKKASVSEDVLGKRAANLQNGTSEEAKKLAAAALSAVKDSASAAGRGKVEISEVRDFAGKEIEVKKLVDADSKEAAEKAKAQAGPPTALDTILEQIKKKPKLSVLDKTKKDWGEFKEDNKGLEDELDAYKKSSNQYLDKVSFLERTDYREFERERDARLASQARRRPDMCEDDQ